MKNSTEEIKQVAAELVPLLEKYNDGNITPQIRTLKHIGDILESEVESGEPDLRIKHLRKDLFPLHGGLSEFYIWDDDYPTRMKLNEPIDKLIGKLGALLRDD